MSEIRRRLLCTKEDVMKDAIELDPYNLPTCYIKGVYFPISSFNEKGKLAPYGSTISIGLYLNGAKVTTTGRCNIVYRTGLGKISGPYPSVLEFIGSNHQDSAQITIQGTDISIGIPCIKYTNTNGYPIIGYNWIAEDFNTEYYVYIKLKDGLITPYWNSVSNSIIANDIKFEHMSHTYQQGLTYQSWYYIPA